MLKFRNTYKMKIEMNKTRKIVLVALGILLAVGMFTSLPELVYSLTIQPLEMFANPTNYLIITQDSWATNTKLQEFKTWKETDGYSVQITSLSEVYTQFPTQETLNTIKAKEVTNIVCSQTQVGIYFKIDNTYYVFGYLDASSTFNKQSTSGTPRTMLLYTRDRLFTNTVTITYRDNSGTHTITVSVPSSNYDWGEPAIKTDGTIEYIKSEEWSITSYLNSLPSLQYVLFVGRATIPSFNFPSMIGTGALFEKYWGISDYGYVEASGKDYKIGRIPTDNLDEMEIILQKTMDYNYFQTNKMLYMKGIGTVDDEYNTFLLSTYNSICRLNPSETYFESRHPESMQMFTDLNTEKDYTLIYSHGDSFRIAFTGMNSLTESSFSNIQFSESNIVFSVSCWGGNFKYEDFITGEFLCDADSETVLVYSGTLPVGTGNGPNYGMKLFNKIVEHKISGDAFISAKNEISNHYTKMLFQLFGDPALKLADVTITPPEEGWLELTYLVDNKQPEDLLENYVDYQIYYPNGTMKWFYDRYCVPSFKIFSCPVGTYIIFCYYKEQYIRWYGDVISNQPSAPEFNFYTNGQPQNTLTITSSTGGYTSPIEGPHSYDENTEATVLAIPNIENYIFDHWELDGSGSENPTSIFMDEDKSLHAVFIEESNPSLEIFVTPSSLEMTYEQTETFITTVSGGTLPYSYQWFLDTNIVSTGSTYIYNPTESDIGLHNLYCKVNSALEEKDSNIVEINVTDISIEEYGTITISADTLCSVEIYYENMLINTKVPPFILLNLKTGEYKFIATITEVCDQIITKEWTVNLGANDEIEYQFTFYEVQEQGFNIPTDMIVLGLIAICVLLFMKG